MARGVGVGGESSGASHPRWKERMIGIALVGGLLTGGFVGRVTAPEGIVRSAAGAAQAGGAASAAVLGHQHGRLSGYAALKVEMYQALARLQSREKAS